MNSKPSIEIATRDGEVIAVLSDEAANYALNVEIWAYFCQSSGFLNRDQWNRYAERINKSDNMGALVFDGQEEETRAYVTDSTGVRLVCLSESARHHVALLVAMVKGCERGGVIGKAQWNYLAKQLNYVNGIEAFMFDLGEVEQ